MDGLVAAISGLAVAMTGLSGVLWKVYRSNGHQQSEGLELLREIKGVMQTDLRDRAEMRREIQGQFQGIAEALAYLRGQHERN